MEKKSTDLHQIARQIKALSSLDLEKLAILLADKENLEVPSYEVISKPVAFNNDGTMKAINSKKQEIGYGIFSCDPSYLKSISELTEINNDWANLTADMLNNCFAEPSYKKSLYALGTLTGDTIGDENRLHPKIIKMLGIDSIRLSEISQTLPGSHNVRYFLFPHIKHKIKEGTSGMIKYPFLIKIIFNKDGSHRDSGLISVIGETMVNSPWLDQKMIQDVNFPVVNFTIHRANK